MPSSRRVHLLVALAAGVCAALAACGGGDAPATTATPPVATSSTTPTKATKKSSAPAICGRLRAVVTGRLRAADATEISGLVVSPTQPGALWAHNDSGDRARIFALRSDGSSLASLDVPGAAATDWEDIAVGPGGDLLLGDIGDNGSVRESIDIYRVPEPHLADGPSATAGAARLRLTYPDGAHDAETLLADPHTGEIVIVTKRLDGRSGVYVGQAPARDAPGEAVLRHAVDLRLGLAGLATAGDVSGDGHTVAIRTYTALYALTRRPGASLAATLLRKPCVGSAQLGLEGQGESLALSRDGRSFFTVPEGAGAALRRYGVRKAGS
jgi:hypothetical protein